MKQENKRSAPRNCDTTPILLLTHKDYTRYQKNKFYYTPAVMQNYGKSGIYFEADHALQPGMEIYVKVQRGEAASRLEDEKEAGSVHRGRVRWCRTISGGSEALYGVGMEIFETVSQAEIVNSHLHPV